MLYTDWQSGRIAAVARHVSFAQITCFSVHYIGNALYKFTHVGY